MPRALIAPAMALSLPPDAADAQAGLHAAWLRNDVARVRLLRGPGCGAGL